MTHFGRSHAAVLSLLVLVAQQSAGQPSFKVPKPEFTFAKGLMDALEPPKGTDSRDGGAGQSLTDATAHQTLVTKLSVEDLLAFYQERFSSRGWVAGTSHVEQDLAFQVLRLTDKEGAQFLGLLVVAATDDERGIKSVAIQAFPVSAP